MTDSWHDFPLRFYVANGTIAVATTVKKLSESHASEETVLATPFRRSEDHAFMSTIPKNSDLPFAEHRVIETAAGRAVGCSYQWHGGQYCSLNTPVGVVGCGIFDLAIADKFGMAFAIARGTPEHPLRQPEDLLEAKIVGVSQAASEMGIVVGMSGRESLDRMLAAHLARCDSGGRVSQFGDNPPAPNEPS